MTQNIFRAGFDPERCANMSEDWFDDLLRDTRIVRGGARFQSIRRNAVFVLNTIEGMADKVPTSPSAREVIQEAFDVWQAEPGKGLTSVSKMLAMRDKRCRV